MFASTPFSSDESFRCVMNKRATISNKMFYSFRNVPFTFLATSQEYFISIRLYKHIWEREEEKKRRREEEKKSILMQTTQPTQPTQPTDRFKIKPCPKNKKRYILYRTNQKNSSKESDYAVAHLTSSLYQKIQKLFHKGQRHVEDIEVECYFNPIIQKWQPVELIESLSFKKMKLGYKQYPHKYNNTHKGRKTKKQANKQTK